MQSVSAKLNDYIQHMAGKIRASSLPDVVKSEMIAAYGILADEIISSSALPHNAAYASYENSPELALGDAFDDRMPELCPKAWALREERRLARLSNMD